ncbi:MAG: glycosyltransferase [Gaiellaceae bacterium MAG52_C11]|nr:glycosyltransferase [Candidatus Gaiellasilicea maunaloa]
MRAESVVLVQAAVPDYRSGFLLEFDRRLGSRLQIVAGRCHFDQTVRTSDEASSRAELVHNVYFFGRRLLWQRRTLKPGVAADVAILEMNPRILSVWMTLLVRRLLGRRSVLWGHAWPRRGRESPTEALRRPMRRLADAIVVYTQKEADELGSRLAGRLVIAAPNALYRADDIKAGSVAESKDFIYVGRLVPSKKPELLIRAFAKIAPATAGSRLIVVGDGPLRPALELCVEALSLEDRVCFEGHVSDRAELSHLYRRALASVSPGYVGLSATQSFSFGVPMIIADDEPHAPEIGAAREGFNTRFFRSGDIDALADTLREVHLARHRWSSQRNRIAEACRLEYSTERMVEGFMIACFGTRSEELSIGQPGARVRSTLEERRR